MPLRVTARRHTPRARPTPAGRSGWRQLSSACAALLLLLIANTAAFADTVEYQGRAVDPASARLLYRETHMIQRDNGRMMMRLVLYQCDDGTVFARKRVDYANSMTAPDFELIDARDGYREGLRRQHGQPVVFVKASAQAGEQSDAIEPGNALVADAGFDEFVTRNWAALIAGRTLALDFAVPAKGDSYHFKLTRQTQAIVDGIPAVVFRMRLSGLFSLFAPHIDVAYGMAAHNLLRFEGMTNIRNGNGQRMEARIDFPAAAPAAIAPVVLQNALILPLKACRIAL